MRKKYAIVMVDNTVSGMLSANTPYDAVYHQYCIGDVVEVINLTGTYADCARLTDNKIQVIPSRYLWIL